jgi:Ca2+-binding RTX toxin-like protein
MPVSLPTTWIGRTFAGAQQLDLEVPDTIVRNRYTLDDILPLDSQSSNLIGLTTLRQNFAFNSINGAGTSIVVIDSGADLNHIAFGPDLNNDGVSDRIVYSYDFTGNNDADASDFSGHGTHVAGIAAGSFNTVGVAGGANVIILKVFPDAGGAAQNADINEALQWVAQNAAAYNIVAVNLSLGNGSNNAAVTTSPFSAAMQAVKNEGVAVVAAAGNSYGSYQTQGVTIPASDAAAWAIGAVYDASYGSTPTTFNGNATDFSSGADRLTAFTQRSATMTDLLAPGAYVLSADLNNAFSDRAGTSMAAPFVTGLVALAQDLSLEMTTRAGIAGQRIGVDRLLEIMRERAVSVFDGDENGNGISDLPGEENDNVVNTQAFYKRIDVPGTMQGVLDQWGTGTANSDALFGWVEADQLSGAAGDDTIWANAGHDTVFGGDGADTLLGEAGNDSVWGGNGADVIYGWLDNDTLLGDAGSDTLFGEQNNDLLFGWLGSDVLWGGDGADALWGEQDADMLLGEAGNDTLQGGEGADTLYGWIGEDVLWGGTGADSLLGEQGNDTLIGGLGRDTMTGGAGADRFYNANFEIAAGEIDLITDYEAADRYFFQSGAQIQYFSFNAAGYGVGAGIHVQVAGGVYILDVLGATTAQLQAQTQFF